MTITIADAAAAGSLPADEPTSAGTPTETTDATPAPDFTGKGYVLEEPDAKLVCQHVEKLWKGQDKRMKPLLAQWEANELTVEGVPGVRTVYDPDLGGWYARVPIGASAVRVGLSKVRELSGKVTATLTVDQPLPDCEPSPDDDGDRAKAELSTRIVKNECTESGLNLHRLLIDAANLAGLYTGSGFLVYEVDPCGGGWTPHAITAHPAATHYDPQQPDAVLSAPPLPPMPGAPDEPEGTEGQMPLGDEPEPLVQKYLAPKGEDGLHALTDDPEQADKRWALKLRAELVTGRQLRFLPLTATGIETADGVILARATTFGALRGLFPEINGWPQEEQTKLMTWRPVPIKDVLPRGLVLDGDGQATVERGPRTGYPADEALCVTLTILYRGHPAYPEGARALCAGGSVVLHKDTQTVWVGEGADKRPECLDLPVAQMPRHRDPRGGNPYHIADAEILAAGEDLRAQLLVDAVETIWRKNHPNVFVDLASTIDPGALDARDGSVLRTNLAGGGSVVYEDVPGVDPNTIDLHERIGVAMDSHVGLRETAQNVASSNVTSGKMAQTIQEQANITLSLLKDGYDTCFLRSCRLLLQLYRAYATQPQLLRYTGDDGRYQVKEWMNTDLGSTRDVRIQRGTSTMLSRTAKETLAMNALMTALQAATAMQDPQAARTAWQQYRSATASNVDPMLGRDPDLHHHRVLRQIHAWRDVPDTEAPPAMSPMPQADPMTGQPMPVQPQPDPAALQCFAPVPVDAQPDVARTRALALGEEMARESTESASEGKRLALALAYDKARQDAGMTTLAEQQQAQQQQAAMQAQMQQQQSQDDRTHASGEAQKDRDAAAQRDQTRGEQQAGLAQQRAEQAAAASQPQMGGMAA